MRLHLVFRHTSAVVIVTRHNDEDVRAAEEQDEIRIFHEENAVVTTHTNTRRYPTPRDLYQTCTGEETALLPSTMPMPVPMDGAISNSRCAGCVSEGQMISAEKAAVVCHCSRRLIYRWIEEGSLHYRELPDGTVLICAITLVAKMEYLEDATGSLER